MTQETSKSDRDLGEIAERLMAIRAELSQGVFADRLGLTSKTIQRWEAGVAIPDGDSLLTLWREFHADPGWVLTGSGAPPALPPDERALLAHYRDASEELRRAAIGVLRGARVRSAKVEQVFLGKVGNVIRGDAGDVHVTMNPRRKR